jgi:IrrE N-terminal-like domain
MKASEIRSIILKKNACVTLAGLLDFCRSSGIAVAHFANFPKSVKKFDGMVTYCGDRPVAIVSLRDQSPSRLAFVLAHEIGHIALHHLARGETISDADIQADDLHDHEESEANEFAAELILGQPDRVYYFPAYMTAEQLATNALEKSQRDRVDPGAIAWNYGWYKRTHFPVARKAAAFLEKDANAASLINQCLCQQIDWECLSDDSQEYLALALSVCEGLQSYICDLQQRSPNLLADLDQLNP